MDNLGDFFSLIDEGKKKNQEEKNKIIGEVSLSDLFAKLGEEKKKLKETEIEKKKEIEQLEKEAKAFESFLYSESTEKEEKLEEKPAKPKKSNKSKKKNSKKEVIANKIEEKEEIQEKVDQNLQKSLDILDKLKRNDTDIENEEDPVLRKLKLEVEQLRKLVESSIRTATAQGGGGEVRLEFLDDVNRDSAKVDGKFLKYDSATGKFIGADASGGGGSQSLNDTLGIGNTSDLGMSVGVVTATFFHGDGSNLTGINVGAAEGSFAVDDVGINTTKNVGIGTTAKENVSLFVQGDARITGVLTVGESSVTIDGSQNELKVGSGVTIDNTGTIKATTFEGIGSNLVGIITQIFVQNLELQQVGGIATITGITTTNLRSDNISVKSGGISTIGVAIAEQVFTTGVITATSFVGDGSNLTGVGSTDNIITGTAATFTGNVNVSGATTFSNHVTIDSSGITVSGQLNDLTIPTGTGTIAKTSDVPTNNNELTNGAGYITSSDNITGTSAGLSGSPNITVGSVTATSSIVGSTVTINSSGLDVTGVVTATTFVGSLTGSASSLSGVSSSFLLDYNNFTNTPTIPTNNNQLTNGAGYITTSFTNTNQLTNGAGFITGVSTFSGDYNDLTNTPTIPTNNNELTNGAGFITGVSTFSGDYNDLTNTPTIPTNNNQLTNGAGYITTSFTNTNQLTNGAGFITASDDITGTSAGLSGSPNITVGSVTATSGEFSGNVTIGGTLTYEDVTNIDSVGLVTARLGIKVTGGQITVGSAFSVGQAGVVTATSLVKSGGTSSQFLKADGSVDSSTYLTSYTETQTLDDVLGLGNTSSTGLSVGVVTATSFVKSSNSGGFLKADGTEDTNTYLTSETQTLDDVLGLGNTSDTGLSVGVITATSFDGNLTGFDELTAPHSSTTKNYSVTVSSKSDHRYQGTGSDNAYYIDGVESPILHLTPGRTYRFTLSSSDMSNHPFRFYLEADKTTQYTTDVTTTSTYAEITVTDSTPAVIHYQCSSHGYMGNAVITHSNTVNTPYLITGLDGANITGVVTATSLVKSGGTSSQFLKADGSVDSSTYLTSYTETDPVVAAINGIVKSNGSTISAASAGTDYLAPDGDGSGLSGIVTNIQAGANITVLESPTGNFIVTSTAAGGGDTVTINATATDILSVSSGDISADDAGADKLVFWDDSESKLTYLTAGSGLSIDGTTITATGTGGISGVGIESGGTSVGTAITAINFSTNLTATASGGIATITASGGGGGGGNPVSRSSNKTTATAGQTVFSGTYTAGFVDVFLNGSKLDSSEFTASNGTSITLTTGATANDVIEIIGYTFADGTTSIELSEDGSPELAANLDLKGFDIVDSVGGSQIPGIIDALEIMLFT